MISKAVLWFLIGLFSFGSLFLGTDVEEVLKVPALISHYLEHEAESNGAISLMEFMAQHYGQDAQAKHQGDNHNHDDLPLVKHAVHLGLWVVPNYAFELTQSGVGVAVIVTHQSYFLTRLTDAAFSTWPRPPQQA